MSLIFIDISTVIISKVILSIVTVSIYLYFYLHVILKEYIFFKFTKSIGFEEFVSTYAFPELGPCRTQQPFLELTGKPEKYTII